MAEPTDPSSKTTQPPVPPKPGVSVQLTRGNHGAAHPTAATGRRLLRDKKSAEAEKVFRACLQHDQGDADAWIGLSTLFAEQQKYREAAYCLWKASRLRPNDLTMLDDLGRLLILDGDYDRAAVIYDNLLALAPDDLNSHKAKSAVLRLQNRIEEAQRAFQAGVRRVPIHRVPTLTTHGPRILRVFGAEGSYPAFAMRKVGGLHISLEHGHFSTAYLLDAYRQPTIDCWIPGDDDDWQAAVPPYDILVNTIADPDVESGALRALARYCAAHPEIPVINRPEPVLATSRDANYRRLSGLPGVRFAKTIRLARGVDGRFDLQACLDLNGFDFPVILRVPGSHTAKTTILANDRAAAEAYLDQLVDDEAYVIQFEDERFRGDLYRKMRIFFIDGQMYPVVHHIDRVWNVHGFNRKEVMAKNEWMMELERAFVTDAPAFLGRDITAILGTLPALVKLDFFGVDFTVTDRGELFIYEMNPAMRHSYDHAVAFPYLRPSLKRISYAFTAMIASRTAAA